MRLSCQDSERLSDLVNRQAKITTLRQQFAPATQEPRTSLATQIGLAGGSFPHHALCTGTLHEFLSDPLPAHTLLTHLAHAIVTGDDQSRPILWIGECTWPYLLGLTRPLLSRSIFLRPSTAAERLWSIDLAIRSQCISGIIADGASFDLACTRRLFLSAQSASVTCLLARPAHETKAPTAASTRWHISPYPSPQPVPQSAQRWQMRLLRRKSNLAAPTDRAWIIEHVYPNTSAVASHPQTGTLRVVAELRDRSGLEKTPPRQVARIR